MKTLKSKWIQITALLLVAVLVCSLLIPAFAAEVEGNTPKEEVVYVNLNADGSVKEINVVNIFELDEAGRITDYGKYESLRNMTTGDAINYSDGAVSIDAGAGKLYYEGKLENSVLPWDISIRYYLDGQEHTAEEIAGKSGTLKIAVSITENTACRGNFFDQYALQASFTLDTDLCKNITADSATIANVGRNKQLTYTILSGKGAEFEITADVTDFEMDSVSINGIPLNLNIEIDDGELMDQITQLQEAIAELDDGTGALVDGVSNLRDGAAQMRNGTDQLKSSGASLKSGAADLRNGATALNDGIQALNDGAAQIQGALDALNAQSDSLTGGSAEFKAALGQLQAALGGMSAQSPELAALAASVNTLAEQYEKLDSGLTEYTGAVAQCATGFSQISGSTTQLAEGSAAVASGAQALYSGADALASGAGGLDQGTTSLVSGINELYDGSVQLKDGTATLRSETADMDQKITDQINDVQGGITGEDTEIESFVSGQNTQVKSVQFAIQADGVQQEEAEHSEPVETETLTLWQKFLRLFGLY